MKPHGSLSVRIAILACLAAAATAPLAAQDLTITNARIIGANGAVIERGSIVVRGGKIASVAPGHRPPRAARIVDAKGMTAMPGFIDAHRHINTGPNEKAADAGAARGRLHDHPVGRRPRRRQHHASRSHRSGQINGPRIIPSGALRLNQHTPESARDEIRKMAAMGIKFTGEIALTPVPGPSAKEMDVLRAVVDEGKKAGVMVQVHAVSTPAMMAAVKPVCRCWCTSRTRT